MARKTEWRGDGPPGGDGERWLGLGQRVLATDHGDHGLLTVRSIELALTPEGGSRELPAADHA